MSTTTFKVFAPSGHVCRRISNPAAPSIEAIKGVVESMVDAPYTKLNLVYVDSDGDRVIIKTQSDIEEVMRDAEATGGKAIKLQVCARNGPCKPRGDPGNARAGNKTNRCTNNSSGDGAGSIGPGQRGRRHCPWRPEKAGQRCGRGFFLGHPRTDPLLWGGEWKEIGEVIEAMLHPFGVRRPQEQRTQTCEPAVATTTSTATATSAADAARPTTTPAASTPEAARDTPTMPAPMPSPAAQKHIDNVGHTEEGQVVVQADEDGQAKDDADEARGEGQPEEEGQAQDNDAPAESLEEEGEYVNIDHAAREEERHTPNNRPTAATADGAKETVPVPPISPEDVATTSAADVGEEEARDELDAKAAVLREMGFDIPHVIARNMIAEMGGRMDLIVRALVANSK